MKAMRVVAIICLLYYLVIICYAGFSTAFSKFWLILGLVLMGVSILGPVLQRRYPQLVLPKIVTYGGIAAVTAGSVLFLFVIGCICSGMTGRAPADLDYIIVLGAQVKGSELSSSLQYRLEKAADYLLENPATIAVLSGGQGPGEDITEAEAMADWLKEHGIAAERLILEDRSENTVQNLIYSAAFLDQETARVGVVSNNFHVYRAVSIARKQGYVQVSAVPAGSDPVLQVHMIVRESLAVIKDRLVGNM